jgi:predicted dehydrogenase
MGVNHITLMLYLMNNPKLERVSGHLYQEVPLDPVNSKLVDFDVEEMGVGLVTFENNLTMDVLETWAINAGPESFPPNLVVGSKAGLAIKPMADKLGLGVSDALVMYSDMGNYMTNTMFDLTNGEMKRNRLDPITGCYNDTVDHWVHALRGHCPLINSKELALNMVKIADGMALSSKYKREMTAQEIEELSVSIAKRTQETPFGTFHYEL